MLGDVGMDDSEDSELDGMAGDESSRARFCGRGLMSLLIVARSERSRTKVGG